MVDAIGGTGTTYGASATATKGLAENFDTFLKLLTTQLQNQDPLAPLDSKEFTEQLVQFTSVEQSIATNQNLEQLVALVQSSQSASVVSYIGKSITAGGQTTMLGESGAQWSYEMPKEAEVVVLTVTTEAGDIVFQTAGEPGKGQHDFTWDGVVNGGAQMPPGLYQLHVAAVDSLGNPVKADTRISGTVTGIETSGGNHVLVVGSLRVPLADVQSVTDASGT